MLKIGNDNFEATHLEPKVAVCDRRYVFDAYPPPNSSQPLVFDPTGERPTFVVNPKIARLSLEKQRADEVEYAQLVKDDAPVAPIYSGLDRRNEPGFPCTASGQDNTTCKSAAADWGSRPAAAASRAMDRQRWLVGKQIFWRLVQNRSPAHRCKSPQLIDNAATRREFSDNGDNKARASKLKPSSLRRRVQ